MIRKTIFIFYRKYIGLICRCRKYKYKFYHNISISGISIIEKGVEMNTFFGGSIKIGKHCEFRSGCKLLSYGGNIIIGENCSVNPYTILYGQGNLSIGNNVRIAAECIIIPSNHNFSDPNIPIVQQGLTNKGIIIEDDVWIGCGVKILDGVKISKGCVIGAGSVVTHSTEPYGIYVGNPSQLIKRRK